MYLGQGYTVPPKTFMTICCFELEFIVVLFMFDLVYTMDMKYYANFNDETRFITEPLISLIDKFSIFYQPERL